MRAARPTSSRATARAWSEVCIPALPHTDIVFAGSSSVIAFTYADRADLLGTMGARSEGMLVVDTP